MSSISAELQEMLYLFNQTVQDVDVEMLKTSYTYTKEREFLLSSNLVRLQHSEGLAKTMPDYVNDRLDEPETIDFGLTELCLPQSETYDFMPDHKWRKVREALHDISSEQDVKDLVKYCDERYLYFGWQHMREAMTILGRPQFRRILWELEGPKVSETENYDLIMEVLDKAERMVLKKVYWRGW